MTSTWGVIAPQRVTTAFISFFLTTQLVCFCDILGPYPLYNFSIVRKKFKYQLGTFDSLTVLGAYSVNLGCTYTPISFSETMAEHWPQHNHGQLLYLLQPGY